MKYGQELRQRSIPAWSHHNIDYDEVKYFIKEQTTPAKGKSAPVRRCGDEQLQQFESQLFRILTHQHDRVDLFVKSKAGEIQRRLDHSKRQVRQLSLRNSAKADQRIPVSRLERYGRLENDLLRAGDEIRSLARFTSAQRTAFRKLLKKYKKWTGSTDLEDRFRTEILEHPKSFTHVDLGPLLDDYSTTLQQIRALFEQTTCLAKGKRASAGPHAGSSVIAQLHTAIETGSNNEFDTALATVPLGAEGVFASYFVHPENMVELQVLLLQHARYFMTRSLSNSITPPISPRPEDEYSFSDAGDFFALEADDAERFAREQNRLTIDEREHQTGSALQTGKLVIRWNTEEEAHVAYSLGRTQTQHVLIRKKHIQKLFAREAQFSARKAAVSDESEPVVAALRRDIESEAWLRPLYMYSSSRTRLLGSSNDQKRITLANLDSSIVIRKVEQDGEASAKQSFPFAVLLVRQEGHGNDSLLTALDHSHLVERVMGFSMEYHAIWLTQHNTNIPAPFWLPLLDRDIRKLPPPMKRAPSSAAESASRTPTSGSSTNGVTDNTTAVETSRSVSDELEAPAIRSFRKKRRRAYPQQQARQEPQSRYWSEYDHPEEGSENDDAFVIYVDPNARSLFDTFFEKLSNLFTRRDPEKEALLREPPHTPRDDGSSSDEEGEATPVRRSYGAIESQDPRAAANALETQLSRSQTSASVPQIVGICFAASLAILIVACILASTGKRKFSREVNFGVIFATASSLLFSMIGFASLLRTRHVPMLAWMIGVLVLVADVVGSGVLLAWMLG
ncbi:SPX domain-containing protein [Teratosphaeria nubilosa]|uniref:SPX domain-containing protein n=1 Tax=Teratosphaeria nubilosa TaxID=161662 RepID=A0A6G1L0F1_9PEZI|nr:SPX domain-containing protein [Teratosphaeria nubilosa]